jgi:M6 family metalloprotease-like protein
VVRIQFEGDPYDDSYSGNPYEFNNFYSDACTWAKKIFYKDQEGQLNHYFEEVSYTKFQLIPATESHANSNNISDGIITVTLSGNHPNPQSDGNFHQKLADAITTANPYIDFSTYDTNGDFIISRSELQVMFLVAGYESATTSSSYPGVWAHKWCLYGQEGVNAPTLDGVTLLACSGDGGNDYSRFGERQTSAGYDATIGVMAHELGHAIWGLPDLYDTDGSSAGIGSFGLMSYGSWGRESNEHSGETPVQPSAWVKAKIGWVVPSSTSGTITLFDTAQSSYNIVKVDITTDEYFLIENRATTSYDAGLSGLLARPASGSFAGLVYAGGIAIWHIDETQTKNSNENLKLVDLEEAENAGMDTDSHNGVTTNLFWDTNQADFDDTTEPNANDNNSIASGVDISAISARGTSMTLTVSP